MIRVSIIIPHYNQPELLRLCLDSLVAQSFPATDCEIIVVDNATPGGIETVIADYPEIIFEAELERGAAAARNAGLARAQGHVIAFIDSDCIADVAWLSAAVTALDAGGADMIGGEVRVTCADPAQPTAVEKFEQVFGFRQQSYIQTKGFSVTANLVVRRAVATAVGDFSTGVSEDVDWCHRARALGFRLVFHGKAIVSHPARRDWPALRVKWSRLIRETYALEQQAGVSRVSWRLRSVVVALSAIAHLPRAALHPLGGSIAQRFKVMGVLVRLRIWRAGKMLGILREVRSGGVAPGWHPAEVALRNDR
ncbi:MAG: glycosyltransferase [Parvularculaceae bacterium]